MADRKKVLTQLAELGIGLDMAGYHNDAQCVRDALALLREPARGWVSVKDRLPEKKQTVMVSLVSEIDGHRMKRPQLGYPADDTGDMWYIVPWGERAVDIDFKVTHWQPMPKPPEEVQG